MVGRVQSTGKVVVSAAAPTIAVTFAAPPTVGHGVIVCCTHNSATADASCTDNRGNTYVLANTKATPNNANAVDVWYCASVTATGAPFTVTVGSASRQRTAVAIEVNASLAVNKTAVGSAASVSVTTAATAPLTVADAVIVAGVVIAAANVTAITVNTVTPPWTQESEHVAGSAGNVGEIDSRIVTNAVGTTHTAGWTWTGGANAGAVLVAFAATEYVPPTTYEGPIVKIAGVDRTTKTRLVQGVNVEYELGARGRATVEILDRDSFGTAYRPKKDERLEITAWTSVAVFRGVILGVDDGPLGDPGVGTVTAIEAYDDQRLFGRRRVKEVYPDGWPLKDIVQDLVTKYLTVFGISLDPTMAAGPTMPGVTFDLVTLEDAFNHLAGLTAGWIYRLRPDAVLEWFAIGTKLLPITFSTANRNITGAIRWHQTSADFFNRLYLRFGSGRVRMADSWNGDGVSTVFKLSYPVVPEMYPNTDPPQPTGKIIGRGAIEAPIPVTLTNGIEYPLGVWGVDSGFRWYVDVANNQIIRAAPTVVGYHYWIEYDVQFPVVIMVEDAASVAAHKPAETLEVTSEIFWMPEARAYADARLRRGTTVPRELDLTTGVVQRFLPGDTVTIDLPERTIPNSPWLVTNVRASVGHDGSQTAILSLLEGNETRESWVEYWRGAFGGSSGSGSASGDIHPTSGGVGQSPPRASYFLGAMATEWQQANPVGWVPASGIQITPKNAQGGTVRVRLRARAGSVTARLQDLTAGLTAGSTPAVASTSFVTHVFDVALVASHTYELQLLPSLVDTDVQGIGYLE